MTNPVPDFELEVGEPVQTAAKAVNAALVSLGGLVALFVTLSTDGLSGADVGSLVTAAVSAVVAVGAVFQTENKPKA